MTSARMLVAACSIFSGLAFAHGGGLNAEGCHTERKTASYHCHGSKAASAQQPAPVQTAAPQRAAAVQPGSATCYTGPRGGTYTITKSGRKNYSGC
jgi:hypothetical protein